MRKDTSQTPTYGPMPGFATSLLIGDASRTLEAASRIEKDYPPGDAWMDGNVYAKRVIANDLLTRVAQLNGWPVFRLASMTRAENMQLRSLWGFEHEDGS